MSEGKRHQGEWISVQVGDHIPLQPESPAEEPDAIAPAEPRRGRIKVKLGDRIRLEDLAVEPDDDAHQAPPAEARPTLVRPRAAGNYAERQPARVFPESAFAALDNEAVGDIMDNLEIHGDKHQGRRLMAADLVIAGQEPGLEGTIGGRRIILPRQTYEFRNRRCATVYVAGDKAGKFYPRTYYLSNSSSCWRYLPDYLPGRKGEVIHFGKGYEEQSLDAPLEVQKGLDSIGVTVAEKELKIDPEMIFAGTARNSFESLSGSYLGEVDSRPANLEGKFRHPDADDPMLTHYGKKKLPPEEVAFSHEADEPDFSRQIDGWSKESPIYGRVDVRVYPSRNERYRYAFGTDESGRSWLMAGETSGKVGVNGLRRTWLDLGDLATPGLEYGSQSGGYGNSRDKIDKYVDMYKNYNSKIRLIQEFEQSLKKKD